MTDLGTCIECLRPMQPLKQGLLTFGYCPACSERKERNRSARATVWGGAWLSDDQAYRYRLQRTWGGSGGEMVFVMLNPSTADADKDDATIRRCIGFAKREGCSSLEVVNLYAGRATDPIDLLAMDDPEGPENRKAWSEVMWDREPDFIVAAWGAERKWLPVSQTLRRWLVCVQRPMLCLGTTKSGAPRHPLYVKKDQPLIEWEGWRC